MGRTPSAQPRCFRPGEELCPTALGALADELVRSSSRRLTDELLRFVLKIAGGRASRGSATATRLLDGAVSWAASTLTLAS